MVVGVVTAGVRLRVVGAAAGAGDQDHDEQEGGTAHGPHSPVPATSRVLGTRDAVPTSRTQRSHGLRDRAGLLAHLRRGGRGRAGHACVHRAFEVGINFFDTANVYGRARPSSSSATSWRADRSSYVLAAKVFPMTAATGPVGGAGPQAVEAPCASAHRPRRPLPVPPLRPDTPLEETMEALTELVSRARPAGSASASGRPTRSRPPSPSPTSSGSCRQPEYSMLWRRPEQVFPICPGGHRPRGLVAAGPGRAHRQVRPGRRRRPPPGRPDERWADDGPLAGGRAGRGPAPGPIADDRAHHGAAGLAWVLQEPTVASAILGASRPEQIDDNGPPRGSHRRRRRGHVDEALGDTIGP